MLFKSASAKKSRKAKTQGQENTLFSISALMMIMVVVTLTRNIADACDSGLPPFQGFGVFLGAVNHLSNSPKDIVPQVLEKVYVDLGIRYFRTSYESQFSTHPNNYSISCTPTSPFVCTWSQLMDVVSKFENVSVFASIWSPPLYMKNILLDTLKESHEKDFYYFIKNITKIIKERFNGLQIEKVSPVNEPENVFAPWEHTNMAPNQLCRMVKEMNDPLISLCPENSYFWMTELYSNYTDAASGVSCANSCNTYATHGYTLDIDYWSPYRFYAYYDPAQYYRYTRKPIWMTEVSSTFPRLPTIANQLREGLDLARHIVNFVGTMCVQRYYFWSIYTDGDSGESLIWGNFTESSSFSQENEDGSFTLYYPKTYHIYRHFTKASFGGEKVISDCKIVQKYPKRDTKMRVQDEHLCLSFKDSNSTTTVFLNRGDHHVKLEGSVSCAAHSQMCCTTQEFDWWCTNTSESDEEYKNSVLLPKKSVCSCQTTAVDADAIQFFSTFNVFNNEV